MPYACSICAEESMRICVRCTKDACDNHLCPKCLRCSDCCECELALDAPVREAARTAVVRPAATVPAAAPTAAAPEATPALESAAPDAEEGGL